MNLFYNKGCSFWELRTDWSGGVMIMSVNPLKWHGRCLCMGLLRKHTQHFLVCQRVLWSTAAWSFHVDLAVS